MKIKHILKAVFISSTFASHSYASDVSYNFLQASIVSTEVDTSSYISDKSIDGSGIILQGSFPVNEDIYLIATANIQSFDYNIDTEYLSLGLGYHTNFLGADISAGLSMLAADVEPPISSNDDKGTLVFASLRKRINNKYEFGLNYSQSDLFDDTFNETSISFLISTPANSQLVIMYSNLDSSDTRGDANSISFGFRRNYK